MITKKPYNEGKLELQSIVFPFEDACQATRFPSAPIS